MYSYTELKTMFENGKVEAKQQVVALLVQAVEPLTAKQLADALNLPVMTISNWLVNSHEIEKYLNELNRNLRLRCNVKYFGTTYVNPENPSDTVTIKKKNNIYWVEKR